MNPCLTIAGSDSSGGAGIQADLKTFAANSVYGMSVITALTAQNTTGVQSVHLIPAEFVAQQLQSVFTDITPEAIKIGMLPNKQIVEVVVDNLVSHSARNIVIDPVMVASSGQSLMNSEAIESLVKTLLPLAHVITPNADELIKIAGVLDIETPNSISNHEHMRELGMAVYQALPMRDKSHRTALLLKGGHIPGQTAQDLLIDDDELYCYSSPRINTRNSHGTGCTLSSAIAANLANGLSLAKSCDNAKHYIQSALDSGLDLGKGCGPLNHQI